MIAKKTESDIIFENGVRRSLIVTVILITKYDGIITICLRKACKTFSAF